MYRCHSPTRCQPRRRCQLWRHRLGPWRHQPRGPCPALQGRFFSRQIRPRRDPHTQDRHRAVHTRHRSSLERACPSWRSHSSAQSGHVGSNQWPPSCGTSLRATVTSAPHNAVNVSPGRGANGPSSACRFPSACCHLNTGLLPLWCLESHFRCRRRVTQAPVPGDHRDRDFPLATRAFRARRGASAGYRRVRCHQMVTPPGRADAAASVTAPVLLQRCEARQQSRAPRGGRRRASARASPRFPECGRRYDCCRQAHTQPPRAGCHTTVARIARMRARSRHDGGRSGPREPRLGQGRSARRHSSEV